MSSFFFQQKHVTFFHNILLCIVILTTFFQFKKWRRNTPRQCEEKCSFLIYFLNNNLSESCVDRLVCFSCSKLFLIQRCLLLNACNLSSVSHHFFKCILRDIWFIRHGFNWVKFILFLKPWDCNKMTSFIHSTLQMTSYMRKEPYVFTCLFSTQYQHRIINNKRKRRIFALTIWDAIFVEWYTTLQRLTIVQNLQSRLVCLFWEKDKIWIISHAWCKEPSLSLNIRQTCLN